MRKPVAIVLLSWLGVFVVAAWAAVGPIHRDDIPTYWSPQFFVTTVLGPLSRFFAWPNPSASDLIFSSLFALALLVATTWYVRRPSKLAAAAFIALTGFWLLLGLSITYAWV
jgi:hypothetical protein